MDWQNLNLQCGGCIKTAFVTCWHLCVGSDRGSAVSLESQDISIRAQSGRRVGTVQLH